MERPEQEHIILVRHNDPRGDIQIDTTHKMIKCRVTQGHRGFKAQIQLLKEMIQ